MKNFSIYAYGELIHLIKLHAKWYQCWNSTLRLIKCAFSDFRLHKWCNFNQHPPSKRLCWSISFEYFILHQVLFFSLLKIWVVLYMPLMSFITSVHLRWHDVNLLLWTSQSLGHKKRLNWLANIFELVRGEHSMWTNSALYSSFFSVLSTGLLHKCITLSVKIPRKN